MVTRDLTAKKVLVHLLKDFSNTHTITTLAKDLGLSRVGIWKVLNKLSNYISTKSAGKGKTSTFIITLNWENPLLEKTLSLYLAEEAVKQRRWQVNFSELEKTVNFVIIYGSVLHSSQEAKDVDILGISSKKNFVKIQIIINKAEKMQSKKIHSINFTKDELKSELKKQNKVFIDAIKKGVVLFGQEDFVKFMREITT